MIVFLAWISGTFCAYNIMSYCIAGYVKVSTRKTIIESNKEILRTLGKDNHGD
jgi:hypothetical protein